MERLADEIVNHVRTVELRRVDVIDTALDRIPQDPDRLGAIARRPEDVRASQAHRAEPDRCDFERTQLAPVHCV